MPGDSSLGWLRGSPDGRAWLESLPGLVAQACRRWSLTAGARFEGGHCSLAVAVTGRRGLDAVLKLQFPDRESEHEAAALDAWAGEGAVRLLDYAVDLRALLIERCRPGTYLSEADPDDALVVLGQLVERLAIAVVGPPFTTLLDEASRWTRNLPQTWATLDNRFERTLLDHALELLDRLPGTQGPQVLIHQDLHADNVLRAERESWLAIDPKPLVGEVEFAIAPIVRSAELGHDRASVIRRLDYLSETLHLDPERARDWAFAQTMAWCSEGSKALSGHLDVARWLLET